VDLGGEAGRGGGGDPDHRFAGERFERKLSPARQAMVAGHEQVERKVERRRCGGARVLTSRIRYPR
jgi:hypothetical protein